MHTCSHIVSRFFNKFLLHSNRIKYIGSLMDGLSVTGVSSSRVSSNAYFTLFMMIILWTLFESLSSVELSMTITFSHLLLSVELTCHKFSSVMIPFDFLMSKEQTCRIVIQSVLVIYVLWANVKVKSISSQHTHSKLYLWINITVGRLMFGPLLHITLIRQLLKLLNNLINVLQNNIINGIPYFLIFFDLTICTFLNSQMYLKK